MKDIAIILNILHTTDSRTLQGNCLINKETRKKVIVNVASFGYVFHQNPLNSRTKTINKFAAFVSLNHNIFCAFIRLITAFTYIEGLAISAFLSKEQHNIESTLIKTIIYQHVGDVIASTSNNPGNGNHFEGLRKFVILSDFFDLMCENLNRSSVFVGNYIIDFIPIKQHGKEMTFDNQ